MAAALGHSAMAEDKKSSVMPDVTRLQVGKTTDKDIEAMLGKPANTYTSDYNKYARWEYSSGDMKLNVEWNTKNMTIDRYYFSTNQRESRRDWNAGNMQYVVPGEATLDDVLTALGTPVDLQADKKSQFAKYNYKNHSLTLRFSNGTLIDMTLNYLEKKKD